MSGTEIILTEAEYQQSMAGANGLLVVHKPQCPNCRAMEKVIEKFRSMRPELNLLRLDSVACPAAAAVLGAERVPLIGVVRDGKIVARKFGLMNVRELVAYYQAAMADR